ncbi:MAG: hypothetical protein AB7O38_00780 [Pirellulaceae bacterium]
MATGQQMFYPDRLGEVEDFEDVRVVGDGEVVAEQGRIGLPLHWVGRAWAWIGGAFHWLFGLASLLATLAFLAAIPILQLLSLGYLLEASGRIAREGRLSAGFIGIRTMGRLGSLVLGTWLCLWPLRLLSDLWYSAQLISPDGRSAANLRLALVAGTVGYVAHILMAWYCGGRLRHFFWPLFAPFLLAMWTARRIAGSRWLRPVLRPGLAAISPRLWDTLTRVPPLATWFPPAILWQAWRRGVWWTEARDASCEFLLGLRLPYYFWLGMRGFAGAVLWLSIPALMIIGMTKLPALVQDAGANLRSVRFVSAVGGLSGFLGALGMAGVLLYLPFLQAHFASENRFRALFAVGEVRRLFQRAPVAFWFALFVTLLFATPLYLLKIEYTPRELLWLPNVVFVVFLFPARLIAGWALARARRREAPRWWLTRWAARLAAVPVVAAYVLILFFTQYVSWDGAWSLLEQHPFLLPAPFFGL